MYQAGTRLFPNFAIPHKSNDARLESGVLEVCRITRGELASISRRGRAHAVGWAHPNNRVPRNKVCTASVILGRLSVALICGACEVSASGRLKSRRRHRMASASQTWQLRHILLAEGSLRSAASHLASAQPSIVIPHQCYFAPGSEIAFLETAIPISQNNVWPQNLLSP